MTKFGQVGVNMQYESMTKEMAQKRYSRSCECCCSRGMRIKCEQCAISVVHQLVVACFESK